MLSSLWSLIFVAALISGITGCAYQWELLKKDNPAIYLLRRSSTGADGVQVSIVLHVDDFEKCMKSKYGKISLKRG